MIHVLQIMRGFHSDGPGRLVQSILRAWNPEDIRVSIAAFTGQGALRPTLEEAVKRLGGEVHVIGEGGLFTGDAANRIALVATANGVTHLHAHLLRADLSGRRAARRTGLPYFVTEHGVHAWSEKGATIRPLFAAWYRATLREGITICAISEKVRRDLEREGVRPDRIIVVPNGVDLDSFRIPPEADRLEARREWGLPEDAFPVIVTMGSLTARKSPRLALESFAALRANEFAEARLVFAGQGREEASLLKRARAILPASAVQFVGQVGNPESVMRTADILLHPAVDEPFGLVVAEAMACGIPAVVRAGSGADDILAPGGDGVAVEGSDPAAWSGAMTALARRLSKGRHACAARCRERAVNLHDIRFTAKAYRNLYT